MSGIKISNLPASTTPLSGSEIVPLVQGGVTKRATVTQIGTVTATGSTTARTLPDRFADVVNVKDFGAVGDGVTDDTAAFTLARNAAASANKSIVVPAGSYLNGKPSSAANKNIVWDYICGGDADNVLTASGDRGGLFADFDCKATRVLVGQFAEAQPSISLGSFRDVLFLNAVDSDTTNYTAIGQTVTHAIRAMVQGAHNGSAYQAQYKDLVGSYFTASGNIQWADRGVSAITADAYQFGLGIASNEFAVNNPSAAGGSLAQSKSMAAVQAIVRSRYADEDATHVSRGVFIANHGLRITNGLEFLSVTSGGFSSHFKNAINMAGATVTNGAILMPQSATGHVGTIIEYDGNDFTIFDRTDNWFGFSVGGTYNLAVTPKGISVGSVALSTNARLFIAASTTALSHIQLSPGVTPSTPANGELWFDGTDVKIVVGGVVKTFTLT